MSDQFEREYFGYPSTDDGQRELRILAVQYLDATESYDRRVCSGPIKHGEIMPATWDEQRLITRNAFREMNHFREKAILMGFSNMDFLKAIKEVRIRNRQ